MEESSIAPFGRKEPGDFKIIAAAENHAVEGTINHIADCARQHQRKAHYQTRFGLLAGDYIEVVKYPYNRNNPENTQDQFPVITGKLHPEGHAWVLGKMDDKPLAQNKDFLAQAHGCFNPELNCLINNQHNSYDKQRFFQYPWVLMVVKDRLDYQNNQMLRHCFAIREERM